jgi:hypothetical protein
MKGTISNIVSSIGKTLSSMASKAAGWGRNLMKMFIDGIRSKIAGIIAVVSGVAETVKDYLGFHSPAKKGPAKKGESDRWMLNLMDMFVAQIEAGAPRLQAAAIKAANQLKPLSNVQLGASIGVSGQKLASTIRWAGSNGMQRNIHITINTNETNLTEEGLYRVLRRMEMMENGW